MISSISVLPLHLYHYTFSNLSIKLKFSILKDSKILEELNTHTRKHSYYDYIDH